MPSHGYDPTALRALAVSDTGFVFDPRTGHSYSVNATGLAVLDALKNGTSVDEVVERLRGEFETGASPVEDDVEAFLALLRDFGLGGRP